VALPVPLAFALVVGGGCGTLTAVALLYDVQRADAQAHREANTLAADVAMIAADQVASGRTDRLPRELTATQARYPDAVEVEVLDVYGQVIARTPLSLPTVSASVFTATASLPQGGMVRVVARHAGLARSLPLAIGLVALDLFLLGIAALVAQGLASRTHRPFRRLREAVERLTQERFTQESPPRLGERDLQAAVDEVWTMGRSVTVREQELAQHNADLAAQNIQWQRRYGTARGLIDLMAEFNRAMGLQAVLSRLSAGLSRFFAGDGVAIWIRDPQRGDLLLRAQAEASFPERLGDDHEWARAALAGLVPSGPAPWLELPLPTMATPLLDARGVAIGVVGLVSQRRSHYTVEDQQFLQTVIGHAALAIQNAAVYEYTDTLSRIDGLTGLQNRRQFDLTLGKELERARHAQEPLSLLMIDIDHFKHINDARGHQAGDLALRQLSELIHLTRVRAGDAAFRFGGEEFAILLTQADKAAALTVAERLRRAIESSHFVSNDMKMTVSVGVASYPTDADDLSELVAGADRALYAAKNAGRNQVRAA
jgi:diguanylate cyclase (GGDEF)-like protein